MIDRVHITWLQAPPGAAVVAITVDGSRLLSNTIPSHGFIISSQVCVPPYTSTVGSGLPKVYRDTEAAEIWEQANDQVFVMLEHLIRGVFE